MTTPNADYVWPDPHSEGWVDAWNGWYPTKDDALRDAFPAVSGGVPWDLAYGEGLIDEDELVRRRATQNNSSRAK